MKTDVDQLLRDTLHGRAATVAEAPRPTVAPIRAPRTAWAAVAATVAVLGLAAGLVAVRAGGDDTGAAGGEPAAACVTTLPTAWQRAAHRLEPHSGPNVDVRAVTSKGVGIGEATSPDPGYERIVLVAPDGAQRRLWQVRIDRTVLDVDTDGTSAVFAVTAATREYEQRPAVDDLAVLDLRSGHIRHVLAQAPIPVGWIISWHSTVLQDGVVYVVARPPAATAGTGDVFAYTIATGTYRVVGHAAVDADPMNSPQLVRDVRGVGWRGGSVPSPHAPQGLPAFFAATGSPTSYQPVHSDGRTVAWQDVDDPFRLYWRDDNGDISVVNLQAAMGRSAPAVNGVAGPFVLLAVPARATQYLIDTRAPAVARFDVNANVALTDRGVLRPTTESTGLLLGAGHLPGLHC